MKDKEVMYEIESELGKWAKLLQVRELSEQSD